MRSPLPSRALWKKRGEGRCCGPRTRRWAEIGLDEHLRDKNIAVLQWGGFDEGGGEAPPWWIGPPRPAPVPASPGLWELPRRRNDFGKGRGNERPPRQPAAFSARRVLEVDRIYPHRSACVPVAAGDGSRFPRDGSHHMGRAARGTSKTI